MLKAILEGKAGRVSLDGDLVGQSWRDVFKKREDLLTSVFFGRLRYLSREGERQLLKLLIGDNAAECFGEILEIIFWPRIRGLTNRNYVEPDVLIFFQDNLLIVEVKPNFGGCQKEEQWANQIQSIILQRNLDNPDVITPNQINFLALGNNTFESKQAANRLLCTFGAHGLVGVYMCEWVDVYHGVHMLFFSEQGRDKFVYKDMLDAFSLFGLIQKPLPFSDLLPLAQMPHSAWRIDMLNFNVPN